MRKERPALLEPRRITDELNTARLGLISIQERLPEAHDAWEDEYEEGGRKVQVKCASPAGYGVPHGLDNDIAIALHSLYAQQGLSLDGTVTTSARAMLREAGLDEGGKHHKTLHESLQRLLRATYQVKAAWRDQNRERWIDASFSYIDDVVLGGENLNERGEAVLTITLNRFVRRSMSSGYVLTLDQNLLSTLKTPGARALYRLLEAMRRNPEKPGEVSAQLELSLTDLARLARLIDTVPRSVRRALEGGLKQLQTLGYLEAYEYRGRGHKQSLHLTLGPQALNLPDPQTVAGLVAHGIGRKVAQDLTRRHGRERITQAIELWQRQLTEGYKPKSKTGYLVYCVEHIEEIGTSEGYVSAPVREDVRKRREKSQQLQQAQEQEEQISLEDTLKTLRFLLALSDKELTTVRSSIEAGRLDGRALISQTLKGEREAALTQITQATTL